jgi:hypothetical protein
MIEFVLIAQICNNIDADCVWQRMGRFASEERCVMHGLGIPPPVVPFKCVRTGPDQRVPLPRPRPTSAP